jgi:hypothetical protein
MRRPPANAVRRRDCGMVGVADHLIGWQLGLGILALAGSGLLWLGRTRPAQ